MNQMPQTKVFKPSRSEAKADTTTRTARMIVESETAIREAKTERLRLARLAMEAAQPVVVPTKAKRAPRKAKA
jgi:hypothetical protein